MPDQKPSDPQPRDEVVTRDALDAKLDRIMDVIREHFATEDRAREVMKTKINDVHTHIREFLAQYGDAVVTLKAEVADMKRTFARVGKEFCDIGKK